MVLMLCKFMCLLDDYIDVILVDYCVDVLVCILLYLNLFDNIYYILVGEKDSVSFV